MNDNEKLIEEAAITIREADGALSHGDAVLYAEAALAVFKKAHTPTDDEREALGLLIRDIYREHGYYTADQVVADAILAAGFRRSEVPEPRLLTGVELDALLGEPQGEPSDAHLRGRWSNGDPVHIITDGVDRWIAPNHNGATWIAGEA